ncbi:endolysin [Pectobacterium phage PPWS1]|uniref:Lysozyme n=1 Tax=Pectobacterium phage PPWS1 TaxID=1685500 RepID=A0A0P0UWN1_9CAUD|nr:endolysin [Pectobacterium phage PPWS1]BAS69568.1 endolysin [Pectobacterium phage PPWS1]
MSLKNKIIGALFGVTALGGGIISVVKHNEGLSQTAYKDSAGVWTICYGETKGVRKGLYATQKQCDAQLIQSITEHAAALEGLPESLPDVVVLGSIDMTYNIGVYGFKNSTIKQLLMKKDYAAAERAVLSWRYITVSSKKYDCSQLVQGKPNKVCWGLWERRQWQSKAIGNEFKTVQAALDALSK